MRSNTTFAVLIIFIAVLAGTSCAQFSQVVGVSGTSMAGTSFELLLDGLTSGTEFRNIPFGPLPSDYSAVAMAQLMVLAINDNYYDFDRTGWQARNATKADGSSKYDATFEIFGPNPVDMISIGPLGGPSCPVPRSPGVGYNPMFMHHNSNVNSPYTPPWPGTTSSQLTLNGQDPNNDFNHRVEVPVDPTTGGTLDFVFSSWSVPGASIMFLAGDYNPGNISAGSAGTIDLGQNLGTGPTGVFVLVDGIFQLSGNPLDPFFQTNNANPATHTFSLAAPPGLNLPMRTIGFQGLMFHPSIGGIGYALTQAAVPYLDFGRSTLSPVSQDGVVVVPFLNIPGGGSNTFDFYGQTNIATAFVHENGAISFGTQQGFGPAIDPQFLNTQGDPVILANYSDWDLQGTSSGAIEVYHFGDEVRFRWGTLADPMSHFGQLDQAAIECTLKLLRGGESPTDETFAIFIDNQMLADSVPNDALIGITAGADPITGTAFDPNADSRDLLSEQIATGNAASPGLASGALLELEDSLSNAVSSLAAANGGGTQLFHDGASWNKRVLGIFPPIQSSSPTGSQYHSIASRRTRDAAVRMDPGNPPLSANSTQSQPLQIAGFFRFLFREALIPTSTNPIPTGQPLVLLNPSGSQGTVSSVPTDIQTIILGVMLDTSPAAVIPPPAFLGQLPFGNIIIPPATGYRDWEGLRVLLPPGASIPGLQANQLLTVRVDFGNGVVFDIPNAVPVVP